jgi:hypothetical protein
VIVVKMDERQLAAMRDRLIRLPNEVQNRVVGNAISQGIKPVLDQAKQLVPVRFGLLRESLGVKRVKYGGGATQIAMVGARKEVRSEHDWPVKYSHLVELGTRPHDIQLTRPLQLGDVTLPAGTIIHHPGSKPNPFLRTALRMKGQAALNRARVSMLAGIDRQVRKLGVWA